MNNLSCQHIILILTRQMTLPYSQWRCLIDDIYLKHFAIATFSQHFFQFKVFWSQFCCAWINDLLWQLNFFGAFDSESSILFVNYLIQSICMKLKCWIVYWALTPRHPVSARVQDQSVTETKKYSWVNNVHLVRSNWWILIWWNSKWKLSSISFAIKRYEMQQTPELSSIIWD